MSLPLSFIITSSYSAFFKNQSINKCILHSVLQRPQASGKHPGVASPGSLGHGLLGFQEIPAGPLLLPWGSLRRSGHCLWGEGVRRTMLICQTQTWPRVRTGFEEQQVPALPTTPLRLRAAAGKV